MCYCCCEYENYEGECTLSDNFPCEDDDKIEPDYDELNIGNGYGNGDGDGYGDGYGNGF
jgi:hypothetical protein